MTFRDLLVGVKQKLKNDELTPELLAEMLPMKSWCHSRLSRTPTVTGDGYRFYKPVLKTTHIKIEWYSRFSSVSFGDRRFFI